MNRDGTAIFQTAQRIRKFTGKKGLLFVISDGQPASANYSGYPATEHTRKSVEQAERMGFVVIQIAVEPDIRSKDMFKTLWSLPT